MRRRCSNIALNKLKTRAGFPYPVKFQKWKAFFLGRKDFFTQMNNNFQNVGV